MFIFIAIDRQMAHIQLSYTSVPTPIYDGFF